MLNLPSSWYSFSSTFYYREILVIPVVVGVLWILWMRLVGIVFREESTPEGQAKKSISVEEAYLDAVANELVTDNEVEQDDDDGDNEEDDDEKKDK